MTHHGRLMQPAFNRHCQGRNTLQQRAADFLRPCTRPARLSKAGPLPTPASHPTGRQRAFCPDHEKPLSGSPSPKKLNHWLSIPVGHCSHQGYLKKYRCLDLTLTPKIPTELTWIKKKKIKVHIEGSHTCNNTPTTNPRCKSQ